MKTLTYLCSVLLSVFFILTSCTTSQYVYTQSAGPATGYTSATISHLQGFGKERRHLLRQHDMSKADFVRLSTDSAWSLSAADRNKLRDFRLSIPKPDSTILLQKVISLEKMQHFAQNDAKGIVDGFVAVAADVKTLDTYTEVYDGLRLDYEGTPFNPADGAGYALVRFYSSYTDELIIPFCEEMGGSYEHAWPCSGGGFTASSLGDGGYPEWFFPAVHQPKEGAEIYRVSPKGEETLTLVYRSGKWVQP